MHSEYFEHDKQNALHRDGKHCEQFEIKAEISTIIRMYSSRMRTVRCSGNLGVRAVSAREWGACPEGVHLPPMNRMTDTQVYKHYLYATTVADGNYTLCGNYTFVFLN